MAKLAGLGTYRPRSLRAALEIAIPGLIVPSLLSMHSMKSQLQAACPDIHLSKLFKKGQQSSVPPPTYWNPSSKALTMSLQVIKRQSSQTQAALYTLTVVLSRMHRDTI